MSNPHTTLTSVDSILKAKELEEKIRAFDLEKMAWDEEQREMEQSLRRKSLESNASKE